MTAGGNYGPIEVFRAGTFSPMEGNTATITENDLLRIAASYDAVNAPAPAVIGHPQLDAPAYGWIDKLYVEGGKLKAMLRDTVAEFADMVKAGRYKRVSLSLFLPDSAANPKPGDFYLKHVGFLGAAAPAIPGLAPVSFAGGAKDTFSLSQDTLSFAAEQHELSTLRRRLAAHEVERLVESGRVLPVMVEEVLSFAASLDSRDTVSFSKGNDTTQRDWFMSYLARQPKVVSFGAMQVDDGPGDHHTGSVAEIAVPEGYAVDAGRSDLYRRAREIEAEQSVSFAAALNIAARGSDGREDVNRRSNARKF